MNTRTLMQVLTHHGITSATDSEDTATDNAREAGLIYACLGCGSVGGINPLDTEWECNGSVVCDYMLDRHGRSCDRAHRDRVEANRIATRDAYVFDCCPDSTTVLF